MNPKFESVEIFRDIHKGKPGFVLGSGYSLTEHNINKIIEKGISFSCNSSISSIDNCDYFIFTDGVNPYYRYYKKATQVSKNMIFAGRGIDYKFYYEDIDGYGNKLEFKAKKYLIDRRYDKLNRGFLGNTNENDISFEYVDGRLLDGTDVCHVASHLAYVCGCDPIILIGVDLNYKNNERYHKEFSGELFQEDSSPYKYMDSIAYFGKNNENTDNHLLQSLMGWKKIKTYNPDLNIKNTNPNGLLTGLFETIDLKEYDI